MLNICIVEQHQMHLSTALCSQSSWLQFTHPFRPHFDNCLMTNLSRLMNAFFIMAMRNDKEGLKEEFCTLLRS